MEPVSISRATARRFVLGRQGLWPGRRWKGQAGTRQALRECEAVQLDPLNVAARSQDLVLHSRVLDYRPEYLQHALYRDRQFFDYGGWLAVYPMSELPYWRVHMERRSHVKRVEDHVFRHAQLFDHVRAELRQRGPLGNRDFQGRRLPSRNYRGSKESSLVLYDMWISGELMMHHRDGFNRVYDFRENIAPREFDYVAPAQEAQEFFARKAVAFKGLMREDNMRAEMHQYTRQTYTPGEMRRLLEAWMEGGMFTRVQLETERRPYLVLTTDLPLLEALGQGRIPRSWGAKDSTTLDEVTLLSALDIVTARGRARQLFDFDYKWEVYVPAGQRRWGYYVLPILYGDDLVGRLDPKLDRGTMTLQIRGFWLEADAPLKQAGFARALARGLARFASFLEAGRIELSAIQPAALRAKVKAAFRQLSDVSVP